MATSYTNGPAAAGAAAGATVGGKLGAKVRITAAVWSLTAAPAAPVTLTIVGRQSRIQFTTQIVAAGPQSLTLGSTGAEYDPNESVDGTISAPGGAVVATLDLLADFIPI